MIMQRKLKETLSIALALAIVFGLFAAIPLIADAQAISYAELLKMPGNISYGDSNGNGFSEGLLAASSNNKYGYVDKTGKTVIPFKYDWASSFCDGLALVGIDGYPKSESGKLIFIDKSGNTVIPSLPYYGVNDFHDGLACVSNEYDFKYEGITYKTIKSGFIDKTGKVAIPIEYNYAVNFSEGLAAVGKDSDAGFIDTAGKIVIPFDKAFSRYLFPSASGQGNRVFFEYNITSFSGGIASLNGKWIDKSGKTAPAPGRASLEKVAGEKVSSGRIPWILNDNYAVVYGSSSEGSGLIDKTGKFIVQLGVYEYGSFHSSNNGLLTVASTAANTSGSPPVGIIDLDGNVIVPLGKYSLLGKVSEDGLVTGTRDGSTYLLQLGAASATTQPSNSTLTAKPTAATVLVNGKNVAFDAYNINGNNYFKLRDLAYTLSGTEKQFEVGWDGAANAIALTSGEPYTEVGGEMTGKGAGDKKAIPTSSKIYLDGKEVQFTAYNIEGNNYFKLRDVGASFDFGVDWDGAKNTIAIDTSKGYTPE